MKKNDYHYSVTVRCSDISILYCLRGLSMYSQQEGNVYIPWGGTSENEWKRDNKCVTFRFTRPAYRRIFREEATRVLPSDSFQVEDGKDDDPPKMTTKDIKKYFQKMGGPIHFK